MISNYYLFITPISPLFSGFHTSLKALLYDSHLFLNTLYFYNLMFYMLPLHVFIPLPPLTLAPLCKYFRTRCVITLYKSLTYFYYEYF